MMKLCKTFRSAASSPKVWSDVDFDTGRIPPAKKMEALRAVTHKYLSSNTLRSLSLANFKKLKQDDLIVRRVIKNFIAGNVLF